MLRIVLASMLAFATLSMASAQVNGALVFQCGKHIFTVNPDGTGLTRVSRYPLKIDDQWSRPVRNVNNVIDSEPPPVWPRFADDEQHILFITGKIGHRLSLDTPGDSSYWSETQNLLCLWQREKRLITAIARDGRGNVTCQAGLAGSAYWHAERTLPLTIDKIDQYQITPTPDGQALLLADPLKESIIRLDIEKNEMTPFGEGTLPIFNADGTMMALVNQGVIYLADADGGQRHEVLKTVPGVYQRPPMPGMLAFSPDGRWLAYCEYAFVNSINPLGNIEYQRTRGLYIIDLHDSSVRRVPLPDMSVSCPLWRTVLEAGLPTPALTAPADWASGVMPGVVLKWQTVPGAQQYRVQVARDHDFPLQGRMEYTVTEPKVTLARLQPNTAHYWRVQALAPGKAESYWSPTRAFITDAGLAPLPGRIVFRSTRDGQPDLYLVNADGSNLHRLTNDPLVERSPHFSPDGMQIIFRVDGDIITIHADGTGRRTIRKDTRADRVIFGSDGKTIIFTCPQDYDYGDTYDLNTCDLDGKHLERRAYGEPFSPLIPGVIGGALYRNETCLEGIAPPTDPRRKWRAFAGSADGRRYTYVDVNPNSADDNELFVIFADGQPPRILARFTRDKAIRSLTMSPDGHYLVCTTVSLPAPGRVFTERLWLAASDGTLFIELAPGLGNSSEPDWAPK